MKLIYIDESGNTGKVVDSSQPIHLLGALIIEDTQVRAAEEAIRELGKKWVGNDAKKYDFEFKGYLIRGGREFFSKFTPEEGICIVHDLLAILEKTNCFIGYAAVDKEKSRASEHPHRLAFIFLIERIQDLLKNEDELGLVVADKNKELEQNLISDLEYYKEKDTRFGWRPTKIENVIGSLHFVDSKNDPLIQLADVVSFFTLKGLLIRLKTLNDYVNSGQAGVCLYPEWMELNLSPAEKADLKIYNSLQLRQRFSKMFP